MKNLTLYVIVNTFTATLFDNQLHSVKYAYHLAEHMNHREGEIGKYVVAPVEFEGELAASLAYLENYFPKGD